MRRQRSIVPASHQVSAVLGNADLPEEVRQTLDLADKFGRALRWLRDYLLRPDPGGGARVTYQGTLREAALDAVVDHSFCRALRLGYALVELVSCGWGDSAVLVARCLIDLRLRMQWLVSKESHQRAMLSLAFEVEEKLFHIRLHEQHDLPSALSSEERARLRQQHEATYREARRELTRELGTHAARKRKCPDAVRISDVIPGLRDMAQGCNELVLYDLWYRQFSIMEHNTLGATGPYTAVLPQGGHVRDITPSPIWCTEALLLGIQQFLFVLQAWRHEFGLPASASQAEELEALVGDLAVKFQ
jgi:hypothetical protein